VPDATRYRPSREYRTEPSEDSDIAVALFRLAVIIAFTGSTVFGPFYYTVQLPAILIVLIAALYTLLLMVSYLAGRRWMTRRRQQALETHPFWGALFGRRVALQRGAAIVIDLLLVSAIIWDIGFPARPYFGVYYVIVAVAAVWFQRRGGVISALGAAACSVTVVWLWHMKERQADPLALSPFQDYAARVDLGARTVMLLTVGLVTGYLARARDAERREREQMDAELRVARTVQQEMLPEHLPELPGYELAVRFTPASLVGGDYYDAIIAGDGRLHVVIADVAGKSVYAVLHLSLLRSHLHEAIASNLSPGATAVKLNEALLAALPSGSFISLFCAAIDPASGKMQYANCGHTPPLLLGSENGEEKTLFTGDIVLGVLPGAEYEEQEETLCPGDCLVCCTDGITEAMDAEWRPFDIKGVSEAAWGQAGSSADGVAQHVLDRAREHADSVSRDDQTIVVVRRRGPQEGT
jgi:serine phosphatase RsbU (regulator of sigma subunit)